MYLQIFSPTFHFLGSVLCTKVLHSDEIQFTYFGCLCCSCCIYEMIAYSEVTTIYMFSCKSFIVLALKIKCLIHLELIFVYVVKLGSSFILFFLRWSFALVARAGVQ